MVRILTWVAGSAFVVTALVLPDWQYPELGYRQASIPLAAGGLGLLLLGAAWTGRWRRSAALFLLLLLGEAASLQLVDAPRYAVYQHYVPWSEMDSRALWLAVVLVQAVVSVTLLVSARRSRCAGPSGVVCLTSLFVFGAIAFSAAVPTVGLSRYLGETLLSLGVMAAALANVVLIAVYAPSESLLDVDRWLSERIPLAPHHSGSGRLQHLFVYGLPLIVTLATASIAWFVLGGTPHVGDGVSYLFQARYLAQGHIFLPSPPDAAAFEMSHVVNDGARWFSKYFPGWPGVLALGVVIGAPWMINPLLAGLTLLLLHRCLLRLYEPWLANLVILLVAVSPWFLFMSSGFMGHPVSLVWTLLALLATERERRARTGEWAAVVGVSVGLLFLTRPLEGVLLAPVIGLWAWRGGEPGWGARSFVSCGIAGSITGALMLPFNRALTGRATMTPFRLWSEINYGPGADVMGFGPNVGIPDWDSIDPIPGHGFIDVLLNMNKNMTSTNVELFGWGGGSLVLACTAVLLWRWRGPDLLFLGIGAAVIIGHVFYWFPGGPDYGARYWYQILIPLVLMTVRGAQLLARLLGEDGSGRIVRRVATGLVAASACALLTFLPWRAWGKYYRYRDIGADGREAVASLDRPSIVFVESERLSDYESVFNLNPVDLQGGETVVAWDRGLRSRAAVIEAFPDRPIRHLRRSESNPRLVLDTP